MKSLLDAGADPLIENDLGHRAIEYCADDEAKKLLSLYESTVGSKKFRDFFNFLLK
jgi:hypothetical protein